MSGLVRQMIGEASLGQRPVVATLDPDRPIVGLLIQRPYGRFGNNCYQLFNALVLAQKLNCKKMSAQLFFGPSATDWTYEDFELRINTALPAVKRENWLLGSLYAPFKAEALASKTSITVSKWSGTPFIRRSASRPEPSWRLIFEAETSLATTKRFIHGMSSPRHPTTSSQ